MTGAPSFRGRDLDRPGIPARAFAAFCRRLFRSLTGLAVERTAPLPAPPFIVCTNHRSHADSAVLMTVLDLPFTRCGLLAAEDYFFRHPLRLRLVSAILTLIPVQRRPSAHSFAATVAECRRFLAAGGAVLIAYPEGTRATGAAMSPFKRGPAVLAHELGLPIVPGYVFGTDRVLPKGRHWPRFAPLSVRLGVAVVPSADGARATIAEVERRVHALAAQGPVAPAVAA